MNQLKNLDQLNSASYFDKNTLQQVVDVNDNALYANLKRWIKQNRIIQLKRGFYVTNNYYTQTLKKEPYSEFIANKLKTPSYLSLEYVLQKYSLLTETVYAFTSITLKKPNTYKNKLGLFVYSNINKELFTGYKIVNKDGFQIKEASKAKALFDFFYLRLLKVKTINKELLKSFRLNLDEFSKNDQIEFMSYVDLSKVDKLKKVGLWLKI
jgi:predicted transcriptional regulator of viral defense system